MTPEEIQRTIEQMLSVQREIQESQIRNTDNIARLEAQNEQNIRFIQENSQFIQENSRFIQENSRFIQENSRLIREFTTDTREDIALLVEEIAKLTVDQRDKFNQFYGYHMAADSDRLSIMERLNRMEQEIEQLKGKFDQES
jgi:hypothetical protein